MSTRIRSVYIPLLVDHDFRQLIGVVLNSRVIDLGDGEYALLALSGVFDDDREASQFPRETANSVWHDFEADMDELEVAVRREYQPEKLEPREEAGTLGLAERLGIFLDTTEIAPDGSVYLVKRQVVSLGDLTVEVYADHEPPHFHVVSKQRDMNARFRLDTLEQYEMKSGQIRSGDVKRVQEYFINNSDEYERLKRMHRQMNPAGESGHPDKLPHKGKNKAKSRKRPTKKRR